MRVSIDCGSQQHDRDTLGGESVTQELSRPTAAPALYSQDELGYDAIVHAHYTIADSDWLVTEYDSDQDVAFGWCCVGGDRLNAELGYTNLRELALIELPIEVPEFEYATVLRVEHDDDWPVGLTLKESIGLLDRRRRLGP